MRTMGLFAGICVDVTVIHFTLRLLMACLTTNNKQVRMPRCSMSAKINLFSTHTYGLNSFIIVCNQAGNEWFYERSFAII